MSALIKLFVLLMLVHLADLYNTGGLGNDGGLGGSCGRWWPVCRRMGGLSKTCELRPRLPLCRRLGQGPVYGGGGQDNTQPDYANPPGSPPYFPEEYPPKGVNYDDANDNRN
ncbi:hypothetical protein AAVH_14801 [Aphelenchoides avenae]|nr:hypothetical protein AAVH_14801 [Aphelenchus avenae]